MAEKTANRPRHWVDFKAIKEAARFEPILTHYGLDLKPMGKERVGRCPFHEDTEPSFHVNLEKRVFHCFGCEAKGNVLDFVAKKEGVGIKKAASLVARWCDLKCSDTTAQAAVNLKKSDQHRAEEILGELAHATRAAGQPMFKCEEKREKNKPLTFTLRLDAEHEYLKNRVLSPETIAHFGLGYCNRGMMKGRIAIPIHNEKGELVAYAGRWVEEDENLPEGEGRYKLPGNFHKSLVVYNLQRIPEEEKTAIVVEGYFSVFWLYQCGYQNVVSIMGTSLSDRQKELLCDRFEKIHLLFDGDNAGRKAGEKLESDLAGAVFVKATVCPEGCQPDNLSKEEIKVLLG